MLKRGWGGGDTERCYILRENKKFRGFEGSQALPSPVVLLVNVCRKEGKALGSGLVCGKEKKDEQYFLVDSI
jgi:hypothetical protein